MVSEGIDIHPVYQRGIRVDLVPNISFVWVKVSDGGAPYSTKPDAMVNAVKAAKRAVGGYHYAQLNPPPETQANVLVGEVRRLGAKGVTPMLDLEAPFTPNAFARDFGIRFCNRVAAAGFRPAVYMSSSFAKALRPDQWGIPNLVIVIARYGNKPEAAGSSQYLGRYDVHQYSSSGSVTGSAGLVDLDRAYTNNHLNPEGLIMAGFDGDDYRRLMWGEVFDTNGNRNYAGFIKDLDAKVSGLVSSNAALVKLVTDDAANDLTVGQVSTAVSAAFVAQGVPAMRQATMDMLGSDVFRELVSAAIGNATEVELSAEAKQQLADALAAKMATVKLTF